MKKHLTLWLNRFWYRPQKPSFLLRPLAWAYWLGQKLDKIIHHEQISPLPVVVVGNLTVGGTGKTPVVIALCEYLKEKGHRVGIVTRAYKNQLSTFPYLVQKEDNAQKIGDEAALIFEKTQVPVVIAPRRAQALAYLHQHQLCDIVISDDGLQHYAMSRQIEIVVIDGMRGFGNCALLPIGPLREPLNRLKNVDFILINGHPSEALNNTIADYKDKTFSVDLKTKDLPPLQKPIAAFAGIGNPERFFKTLSDLNIEFTPYPFPDHHQYSIKDFDIPESCIIMTEKDAIKCRGFQNIPLHQLAIEAKLPELFWEKFFLIL
jgi:tetraacyldisaccharide 4'-kinase